MDSTTLAAWWGAGAGTCVLLWDIYKWWSKGAKLKVVIRSNVCYPDSRVLRTEKTPHGDISTLAPYCHIEIRNVGESPTTLISIEATHTCEKNAGQMTCTGPVFQSLDARRLPTVIEEGSLWSARIEMATMEALAERGRPYLEINSSQSTKPLKVYVAMPKK